MKKAEREAVWMQVDARMGEVLADAPALQEFLNFMSQSRNSLPNQLLLSGQNADITDARTFQQWKDAGRHIRTGEEGYTAIVGQVYENNGRKASGYNIGKVFDITQTRGRPVPPPAEYQVDELIAGSIESSPVPIQISDSLPDGIQAQYVPKNRTIYVRNGMDAGTTLCAIVRECAQADFHKDYTYNRQAYAAPSYCAAYIVKKIHPLKRASSIRWPILFLTFLFPLASFVVLLTLIFTSVNSPDNSSAFLLCGIFLVIANIAVFLLLDWVDSSDEAIKQKLALEQTVQLQAQNMEALGKAYSAQRKITHDFNSQLETIGCLLKSDDSKDAIEFVTALHAKQTTRSLLVNTHHPIVDALLNQKAYIAKDKNIQIHFEVNDLSNLQLDSVDITTILGNLLDNAIEACVIYGENSQIQVKVLLGNTLFFAIRNTCKPVKIIGEYIPTTKPNAQLHGFGLENVKTLLRKYNGEYAMEYDEGWFTFTGEIDNYPIL